MSEEFHRTGGGKEDRPWNWEEEAWAHFAGWLKQFPIEDDGCVNEVVWSIYENDEEEKLH